jgi:uncharacterized membrane protein YqjE
MIGAGIRAVRSQRGHDRRGRTGQRAKEATTQFSAVLHGEIELAKLELKSSVKNLGTGAVGFAIALALALLALPMALIALAELLHWLYFWRWASYLIVFGIVVIVAALAALMGLRKVKKVRAPTRTIETTKSTVAALRHPGEHTLDQRTHHQA